MFRIIGNIFKSIQRSLAFVNFSVLTTTWKLHVRENGSGNVCRKISHICAQFLGFQGCILNENNILSHSRSLVRSSCAIERCNLFVKLLNTEIGGIPVGSKSSSVDAGLRTSTKNKLHTLLVGWCFRPSWSVLKLKTCSQTRKTNLPEKRQSVYFVLRKIQILMFDKSQYQTSEQTPCLDLYLKSTVC